jgi:hypothetical protein
MNTLQTIRNIIKIKLNFEPERVAPLFITYRLSATEVSEIVNILHTLGFDSPLIYNGTTQTLYFYKGYSSIKWSLSSFSRLDGDRQFILQLYDLTLISEPVQRAIKSLPLVILSANNVGKRLLKFDLSLFDEFKRNLPPNIKVEQRESKNAYLIVMQKTDLTLELYISSNNEIRIPV